MAYLEADESAWFFEDTSVMCEVERPVPIIPKISTPVSLIRQPQYPYHLEWPAALAETTVSQTPTRIGRLLELQQVFPGCHPYQVPLVVHQALASPFLSPRRDLQWFVVKARKCSEPCRRRRTHVCGLSLVCRSLFFITSRGIHLNKSFTPLIAHHFRYLLTNHPEIPFVESFISGFANGVRLGYSGPQLFRATKMLLLRLNIWLLCLITSWKKYLYATRLGHFLLLS